MKTVGFLLIFFGIAVGMYALAFHTTVGGYNNIGLMSDRQNILFVAGVLCIMGSIFFAAPQKPDIYQTNSNQSSSAVSSPEKAPTPKQMELQRKYNLGQITFEEYQREWNRLA